MNAVFFSMLLASSFISVEPSDQKSLLATIQNGKIMDVRGQNISREELAKLGFPLSKSQLKQIRRLNIYAVRPEPTHKLSKAKNNHVQASNQTNKCRFDVNNNQICDTYAVDDLQVVSIQHQEFIQYIYQGSKEACWVAGAQKCEFRLKVAESYLIQPEASALYLSPLQSVFKPKLKKLKVNIRADQMIQQRPVECRQYVVALKMNEYSGKYRAQFYEKAGFFKKKLIGLHDIPQMKWKVVVPSNILAEGWLGC